MKNVKNSKTVFVIGTILLLLLCLVSFFVTAKASSSKQGKCSVRIHTKYENVVFKLYKVEEGEDDLLIRTGIASENDRLCWSGLEEGVYRLTSSKAYEQGESYVSKDTLIKLPSRVEDGVWLYELDIYPKFEKEMQKDEESKQNTKDTLPQTGQSWTWIWILLVFGVLSLFLGAWLGHFTR